VLSTTTTLQRLADRARILRRLGPMSRTTSRRRRRFNPKRSSTERARERERAQAAELAAIERCAETED
jgi:hypothetical protein